MQVALGKVPDLSPKRQGRGAGIRFLRAKPGVVMDIEGLEMANMLSGVEEVDVYVQPNDIIPPLVDASGRPGHVICSAENAKQAIDLAERAACCIHIRTADKP